MKTANKILWFIAAVFGLLATFLIEMVLIYEKGEIDSVAVRALYNTLFFVCPIILLINLIDPILKLSVLAKPASGGLVWVFVLLDIALFQVVAFFGSGYDPEFKSLYFKHFLLLQTVNLLFLWVCVCALVGQDRFRSFFKHVMRNPFGAIGYWLGYGATQVGQGKEIRKKR